MDLDKSSDEDNEVESEAPTPQTKGKYVGTQMRIVSTDILLALANEIKDELHRRIPHQIVHRGTGMVWSGLGWRRMISLRLNVNQSVN